MALTAEAAFQILRPLCVSLARSPTATFLEQLERVLCEQHIPAVPQLLEYALYPLVLTVKKGSWEEPVLQGCLQCISLLLLRCGKNMRELVFHDLLTQLSFLLSSDGKDTPLQGVPERNLSEEEKGSAVSCLNVLLQCSLSCLGSLYQPSHLPQLGHTITILLDVAEQERSRDLRVSALQCLQLLVSPWARPSYTPPKRVEFEAKRSSAASKYAASVQATAEFDGGWLEVLPHDNGEEVAVLGVAVHQCAHMLAHFLPGLLSRASRIVLGDPKQGQKVTTAALRVWSSAVSLTMNDCFLPKQTLKSCLQGGDQEDTSGSSKEEIAEGRRSLPHVRYGHLLWWQSTGKNVQLLCKRITTLVSHSHWRVRDALARLASTLLHHCSRSLKSCVVTLVEILVTLLNDDYDEVAKLSRSALDTFSNQQVDDDCTPLVSLLEEGLHSLATTLPTSLRSADEGKKLATVNLLQGYIQLLGRHVSSMLSSPSHLQRLTLAMLMALELDLSQAGIAEEQGIHDPNDQPVPMLYITASSLLHFKHFREEAAVQALLNTATLLGYYGDVMVLVDHLLDMVAAHPQHHKQIVLLLNHVLAGSAGLGLEKISWLQERQPPAKELLRDHVSLLVTEYTQPSVWRVATSAQHTPVSDHSTMALTAGVERPSLETLRSNVLLVCLLLEGLSVCARVLGKDFDQFQLQVLFPVLEKAGDENLRIRHTALNTLEEFARSCAYSSVSSLIGKNADYLLNLCTQHLHLSHQQYIAVRVMCEALHNSNTELLPLLSPLLTEVFGVLDTLHNTDQQAVLLPVLKSALLAVHRWTAYDKLGSHLSFPTDSAEATESLENLIASSMRQEQERRAERAPADPEEVRRFFLEYHHSKLASEGHVDEDELSDSELEGAGNVSSDENQQEEKRLLSDEDRVSVQVLEYCVHLLSAPGLSCRLLILDTVNQGLLILQRNQEQLLPLIHQLWPSLLQRLHDSQVPVATKAVSVIATTAVVAGDFVRQRITKDIWRAFLQLLQRQVPSKYSQQYKLYVAVLDALRIICSKVGMMTKDVVTMAMACLPCLSCKNPEEVQQAAVALFEQWIHCDADSMWYLLMPMTGVTSLQPPDSSFKVIRFPAVHVPWQDLQDNAKLLLALLQS